MYRLQTLVEWINNRIKKERNDSINAILIIILGLLFGILIGFFNFIHIQFTSVIVRLGSLGISFTTIAGVIYYLYKYDEIEDRKSGFLDHLLKSHEEKIEEKKTNPFLYNVSIKPKVIEELILEILKSKINENVEIKKEGDNGK